MNDTPEENAGHPLGTVLATASGKLRHIPWGALSLVAGAIALLSAVIVWIWASGMNDPSSAPRFAQRIMVLGTNVSQPAWVLGIVSILIDKPSARRLAIWGISLWTLSIIVGMVVEQINFPSRYFV
jgi:hypothetical protein